MFTMRSRRIQSGDQQVWLVVSSIGLIVFLALVSSLFALAVTGVPVVYTPTEFLNEVALAVHARPGEVVVDAGCGDGRTLLWLCATEGVRGRGYELNGPVWLVGRFRVLLSGKRRRVKLCWKDFFRCDLEDVDVVYCHLMPAVMQRVGKKCLEEMRSGSRLLSYLWEIPGWTPSRILTLGVREDPLYLYQIPFCCQESKPSAVGPKT